MDDVVARSLLGVAEHPVGIVQHPKLTFVACLGVVRVVPLCQQPENPMNGLGLSVGTDLQNLVEIDSLVRRHTALPKGSRSTRLSVRLPYPASPARNPGCLRAKFWA